MWLYYQFSQHCFVQTHIVSLSLFFLRGGVQLITAGSWRWVRWSWRWTGRPWGAASTGTPHASSQRPSRPKRGTTWTSWWPILTWRYSRVEEETATWQEGSVYCFKWHNSFKQTQRNRLISEPFSLDIWFFSSTCYLRLWDLMHSMESSETFYFSPCGFTELLVALPPPLVGLLLLLLLLIVLLLPERQPHI